MTREEALRKYETARKRKHECAEWMIKELKKEFVKATGEEPKHVEIW